MIRTVRDIPEEIKNIVEQFYLADSGGARRDILRLRGDAPELGEMLDDVERLLDNPPESVFLFYDELLSLYKASESIDASGLNFSIDDLMSDAGDVLSSSELAAMSGSKSWVPDLGISAALTPEPAAQSSSPSFDDALNEVVRRRRASLEMKSGSSSDLPDVAVQCEKDGLDTEFDIGLFALRGDDSASDAVLDIDVDISLDDLISDKESPKIAKAVPPRSSVKTAEVTGPVPEMRIQMSANMAKAHDREAPDDDLNIEIHALNMDEMLSSALDVPLGEHSRQSVTDSPTITPFGDNNPIAINPQEFKSTLPGRVDEEMGPGSSRVPNLNRFADEKTPVPRPGYAHGILSGSLNDHDARQSGDRGRSNSSLEMSDSQMRVRKSTIGGYLRAEQAGDAVNRATAVNLAPVPSKAMPSIPAAETISPAAVSQKTVAEIGSLSAPDKLKDILSSKRASLYEQAKPTSLSLTPVTAPKPARPAVGGRDALAEIRPLTRMPRLLCSLGELSQQNSMNPRFGFLISLIDGHTSISDILDISAWPESETAELLLELAEQNIITFV